MYNTIPAVRLYVEAGKHSWNRMEHHSSSRKLGNEASTPINTLPFSSRCYFSSEVPAFEEPSGLTEVSCASAFMVGRKVM